MAVRLAHPQAIGAALALGRGGGGTVLIEATCNQVSQEGGCAGQPPAAFRAAVPAQAETGGCDAAGLILGDRPRPAPWARLPAADAMDRACAMVAAYAATGSGKPRFDASMARAGDPSPLPGVVVATRAARLAAVAEARAARPLA